jgi:hypothetical protein
MKKRIIEFGPEFRPINRSNDPQNIVIVKVEKNVPYSRDFWQATIFEKFNISAKEFSSADFKDILGPLKGQNFNSKHRH